MRLAAAVACLLGCAAPDADGGTPGDRPDGGGADSYRSPFADAGPQAGCGELDACYTAYANSDLVLYHIDLSSRALVEIGPFEIGENMTDIAVAPDGRLFGISETSFYRIDPTTGRATLLAPLEACGTFGVALTFGPDGTLYAGDFNGAFCRIDLDASPPDVVRVGDLGGGLALAGDLVAVADGTLFGTAYDLASVATRDDNFLVRLDPASGRASRMPATIGWGRLFGVAFDLGAVFAFSHDGSGDVVMVDPVSGDGTFYATFTDPTSGDGIAFAGAGVSSLVPPDID